MRNFKFVNPDGTTALEVEMSVPGIILTPPGFKLDDAIHVEAPDYKGKVMPVFVDQAAEIARLKKDMADIKAKQNKILGQP